jgi:hypothetical protein
MASFRVLLVLTNTAWKANYKLRSTNFSLLSSLIRISECCFKAASDEGNYKEGHSLRIPMCEKTAKDIAAYNAIFRFQYVLRLS